MNDLVEIRNLICSVHAGSPRGFQRKRKKVLNGISLSIGKGSTVGLVGKSGSGKSTLARCIAGIQKPDDGVLIFNGTNIFPQHNNRQRIRLQIQMLFQASGASLNPMMNVRQCIEEGIEAGRQRDSGKEASPEELLDAVGLSSSLLNQRPSQLSGGQKQRVALARSLAVQPLLLILDEPTSALDLVAQRQILSLLRRRNVDQSLLFITHDMPLGISFCDRLAVLHEGRIVEEGPTTDLRQTPQHHVTRQFLDHSRINSSTLPA